MQLFGSKVMFATMGAVVFSASSALASTVVFLEDFSSGSASSAFGGVTTVVDADGYKGESTFADNFLFNATGLAPGAPPAATTLSLSGLAAHTTLTIMFDLAMIDSWDGVSGAHAPDFFNLSLDGFEIFEISVDNAEGRHNGFAFDSIPGTATQTVDEGGYFGTTDFGCCGGAFFDYDRGFAVSVTTAHSASSAQFSFFADGAGYHSAFGAPDESWAIDNVKITTNAPMAPVPVPAALPLLASVFAMLGFLGWRRRPPKAALQHS